MHCVAADPERAQAASLLLDSANQEVEALQQPSASCNAASATDVQEDPFWAPAGPDLALLLTLQVRLH